MRTVTDPIKSGLHDSITFGIPFIFFYTTIGVVSKTNGLTLIEALASTVFVFSTPLQLIIAQNHQSIWIILPVIITLNARFVFMSAVLSPYWPKTNILVLISSLFIVPSIFVACLTQYNRVQLTAKERYRYFLIISIPIYIVSIICTVLGYFMEQGQFMSVLKDVSIFMIAAMFISFASLKLPKLSEFSAFLMGLVFAPLMISIFSNFYLVISPVIIGTSLTWIYLLLQKQSKS